MPFGSWYTPLFFLCHNVLLYGKIPEYSYPSKDKMKTNLEVQNNFKHLQTKPNGAKNTTKQLAEPMRDKARHGKAFAGLLERYFG